MDNLAKDVREAMRLGYGCHYGHYKADHPYTADLDDEPEEPEVSLRVCKECGMEFKPKRPDQCYCCEACRDRHNSRESARRRKGEKPKLSIGPAICPICGGTFHRYKKTMVYCSRSCSASGSLRNRRKKKRETSSDGES